MSTMPVRCLLFAPVITGLLVSCDRSPSAPTGTDISGTWIGSVSDGHGTRQIRYDLTQTGSEISGTLTLQEPGQVLSLLGLVSGSMSRSTFTFKWTVPGAAGCSPFGPNCDLVAGGTSTVSGESINGSYSCSANCVDLLSSGTLSLTRQ